MAFRRDPLSAFQRRLGHRFRNHDLLERALTHRSYANEQGLPRDYERLEFLGDSVLGLLVAEWLYAAFPGESEGRLSELKSYLVSREVLARWAKGLELGGLLRLGVGEERTGGRTKVSLLADSMEAILGAVFLDRDLRSVRKVVLPMLEEAFAELGEGEGLDAKTRLQEAAQSRSLPLPEYRLVAEEGPDHEKRFSVECWLDGRRAGRGEGHTKKIAERRAAEEALAALDAG